MSALKKERSEARPRADSRTWGRVMVWVGPEHELLFARLNERAEVVVQAPLDLHSTSPMKPQLLMDTTGQLHLTWLDKQELTMQLFLRPPVGRW